MHVLLRTDLERMSTECRVRALSSVGLAFSRWTVYLFAGPLVPVDKYRAEFLPQANSQI